MKVSFSREVKFIPTWKGNRELPVPEQIVVMLRPLQMGDLIKLIDSLQSMSGGEVDPNSLTALEGKNITQIKDMISACGDLIPKYCSVQGLEDESGAVSAQSLSEYPYYMELSAEILAELANISMPNEAEEKNSEPQPDTQSTPTQ